MPDARALLDTWREQGADRLDPVRFHFIEALARRSAGHRGDARRLLDDKLSTLLAAYGAEVESAAFAANHAGGAAKPGESIRGPLAELLAYIAGQTPADGDSAASSAAASGRSSYPELPVVDYFRETWSRISVNRQLRQSQEHVPGNAGPLNSSHLVHRSLSLMRALSPGYLHQFLSYVEALAWMEQMNGVGAVTGKKAPRAASAKRGARDYQGQI